MVKPPQLIYFRLKKAGMVYMKHYEAVKVTDRIYMVIARYGTHANVMQFVIGDNRAAIIDTAMGATGNLRTFLEQYTDLPIDCFLTHMHPDHAGASSLFDKRYLNPADDIHCWWALTKEVRLRDLKDACEMEPDLAETMDREMVDNSCFTYTPMNPGDVFDLGGITLEVMAAEGHTIGSVVLYCREENALFGGDAVAPMLGLLSEHTTDFTPVTKAYEDICRIYEKTNDETKFFCGHKQEVMDRQILKDIKQGFENIISGNTTGGEHTGRIHGETGGYKVFCESVGMSKIVYTEGSLKCLQ